METSGKTKALWLDLACILAVGGAWAFAYHFYQEPGWLNIGLAVMLGYAGARIAWEMTINRRHIPTIASAPAVRRQIAALIHDDCRARGEDSYRVVDLGAGRGELARTIAKGVPGASVTGVERSLLPHIRAWLVQWAFGPKNLQAQRGDIFTYDCTDAGAVVMFLGKLTQPVGEKLWRELAPGSLVISNDFELAGPWPQPEALTLHTPFKTVLYIYRK